MPDLFRARLESAIALQRAVLADDDLLRRARLAAEWCVESLRAGGMVLWCGNGGSAADAQHLAAEFSGRFYYDRDPLDSEALHANPSYLTAVANDYGYDEVYARAVRGRIRAKDILIGLSTSGTSANVVNGLAAARAIGARTIGYTGAGGGAMAAHCDLLVDVPSTDTPRIQEAHMHLGHSLCELVEATMFPRP